MSKHLLVCVMLASLCAMLTLSSCQRRQDRASTQKDDFLSSILGATKGVMEKGSRLAENINPSSDQTAADEKSLAEVPADQPAFANTSPTDAKQAKWTSYDGKTSPDDKTDAQHKRGIELFNQAKEALSAGDVEKSKELYLQSCAMGNLYGCHRFGWHQKRVADKGGAQRFYEVACHEGFWKSCNNLGWMAEKERNYERAADFYSWACLNKHPGSCSNLRRVSHLRQLAH